MRLKLRLPSSASEVVTLADNADVADLVAQVYTYDDVLALESIVIKGGFPPKQIDLTDSSKLLSALGVHSGDQLIIAPTHGAAASKSMPSPPSQTPAAPARDAVAANTSERMNSFTRQRPASTHETGPPSVSCGNGSMVVLRVMEDDNSCLFRAIGYVLLRNIDAMHELRSIVASAIQEDPIEYSDVVLGQPRVQYCEWIQRPNSWGGAIEIAILAKHFESTILSIDVATGRVDSFNPDKKSFVVLIYSGIHYDALALAPEGVGASMSDFDQTVFETDGGDGDVIITAAKQLAGVLKERHYFTDVAKFSIKCNSCGSMFRGERQAEEHFAATGHVNFQEVG
ncbi:uncharacterized protein V1518DRAFT_415131 [Limtongia smithiae]|uniref:uncharacterized protein n=1 Tax=Limtongia smithiae TaxID=1125753 RepID=UPI0034CE3EAC